MCVRMHLVSASVHSAPGEPAAPGLFMVEVALLAGSGLSVCRNNADRIPAVGVNSVGIKWRKRCPLECMQIHFRFSSPDNSTLILQLCLDKVFSSVAGQTKVPHQARSSLARVTARKMHTVAVLALPSCPLTRKEPVATAGKKNPELTRFSKCRTGQQHGAEFYYAASKRAFRQRRQVSGHTGTCRWMLAQQRVGSWCVWASAAAPGCHCVLLNCRHLNTNRLMRYNLDPQQRQQGTTGIKSKLRTNRLLNCFHSEPIITLNHNANFIITFYLDYYYVFDTLGTFVLLYTQRLSIVIHFWPGFLFLITSFLLFSLGSSPCWCELLPEKSRSWMSRCTSREVHPTGS